MARAEAQIPLPEDIPPPTLIGTRQVARMAGVNPKTVSRWVRTGRLPVLSKTQEGRIKFDLDLVNSLIGRQPDAPEDHLLTPGDVARLFRVDPRTVGRWANQGIIHPIFTLGRRRRFLQSEVKAFWEEQTQGGGVAPEPNTAGFQDSSRKKDRFLTSGEVAIIFHVNTKTVDRWIKAGRIKIALRTPGGNYKFRESEVLKLLEQRENVEKVTVFDHSSPPHQSA